MSAIGGMWMHSGHPLALDNLDRMQRTLQWMGPHQQQIRHDSHVGFVQCTLQASPLAPKKTSPLLCPQTGCLLVADCRLDNRASIIDRLRPSCAASPLSDPELLLAAYLHWGEETPQHLLGDFAFAIWDPRRQHMLCARDHMGVRPLYYAHPHDRRNNFFALASHPSALLELPGIDGCPNEQQIARYLLQLIPEETDTFYQTIHRLPPGHLLRVTEKSMRLRQYWSPLHVQNRAKTNFPENADQFRALFTEAVQCRIQDADDIASTLSGGLDSSSITCVATQLLKQTDANPLHTFSAIFPSLPVHLLDRIDERKYMDIVRHQCHPVAHEIRADLLHPFSTLAQDLASVGQPFFGPNMYIHNAMFTHAAKAGATVFLDGTDGDSVLSYGFELFPALLCTGRWNALLSELSALKTVSNSRQSLARLFATYALKPLLRAGLRHLAPRPPAQRAIQQKRLSMLQPEFQRRVQIKDLLHRHDQRMRLPTANASAHHRASLAQPFLAHILELQAFFSARHALNIRFPFLDRRLVEFCLSLPPEQKFRNGWSRAIQRQAMIPVVPEAILKRLGKADLSPNFILGLQLHYSSLYRQTILPAKEAIDEYVQVERIAPFAETIPQAFSSPDQALFLYAVANLSTWMLRPAQTPEPLGNEGFPHIPLCI